MTEVKIPPMQVVGNPYQSASVPPNESAVVFEYEVPAGFVAWLSALAWTLIDDVVRDSYWEVIFDNVHYRDASRIYYGLARIHAPHVFNPPRLVKQNVRLTYFNISPDTVPIECFVDLSIAPKRKYWDYIEGKERNP